MNEAENTIGNLAWLCYAKFQIRIGQVGLYVYVQCIIKRPFLDKFKSGRIVSVCGVRRCAEADSVVAQLAGYS